MLCAVWFASRGWGGYGDWCWGSRATSYKTGSGNGAGSTGTGGAAAGPGAAAGTVANMNMVTGSGAAVLSATDRRMYIGKPFQVNDAALTTKVNDHVMWIGQNHSNGTRASMLVVLQGAGSDAASAHLVQGELVNVTGTVDQAPPRAQAKHNWKLSGNGQKRLEQEGAYVAASQVQRESNGNNG